MIAEAETNSCLRTTPISDLSARLRFAARWFGTCTARDRPVTSFDVVVESMERSRMFRIRIRKAGRVSVLPQQRFIQHAHSHVSASTASLNDIVSIQLQFFSRQIHSTKRHYSLFTRHHHCKRYEAHAALPIRVAELRAEVLELLVGGAEQRTQQNE